jgi:hypothetical protein
MNQQKRGMDMKTPGNGYVLTPVARQVALN